MQFQIRSRIALRQWRSYASRGQISYPSLRHFSVSSRTLAIKPFLLADIGEGIRECEIIQWFVEPEARVEEWDKLCEVQSDKASVEITSRFAGVIKKLHYEAGEMAKVGKPLVDIDIQGEIKQEDLAALTESAAGEESQAQTVVAALVDSKAAMPDAEPALTTPPASEQAKPKGKHASLATPAVRHILKEMDVKIEDIQGTGRDGRVLKEDVYQFAKQRDTALTSTPSTQPTFTSPPASGPQTETIIPLSNTQHQMFKTMTKSLSIPHFLYAQEIDITSLSELRLRLNKSLSKAANPINSQMTKLSFLPFIIKAVSMTLSHYPILNAQVGLSQASGKPSLVYRSQHNIGVAMDTPTGLLVPVIKNVQSHTILSLAAEISRLQSLASSSSLTSSDLSSGTFTVSNIGSIGGTYVSPVIVDREVAIMGIGKVRSEPRFNDKGEVIKREICNFSWSADHRVVDGATMARAAEMVRAFVEDVDSMVIHLR